jgi:AraC-like DNA-binding protein
MTVSLGWKSEMSFESGRYESTDFSADGRADEWRRVVGDALVPLELHFDDGLEYPARIVTGGLGPVGITDSRTGPGSSYRTRELIRRSDPEVYLIGVLLEGSMLVEQDGRQARLGPGDIALFDPSRPARRRFTAMRNVAVTVPRPMVPLSPADATELTAVRIPHDDAAGALGASVVRTLAGRINELTHAQAVQLAPTVVDLLAVALSGPLGREDAAPPEARRRALLTAIYSFMEAHLPDPLLSPGDVAAAHHISLRHLYTVFSDQPETIADWIRRRRLERCRRDLLDSRLMGRPVHAIGARWGLISAGQFSRAFRAAYGLPPGAYRAEHGRG